MPRKTNSFGAHENVSFIAGFLIGSICSIVCGLMLAFVFVTIGNHFCLGETFDFLVRWVCAVLVCIGIFFSCVRSIFKSFMH